MKKGLVGKWVLLGLIFLTFGGLTACSSNKDSSDSTKSSNSVKVKSKDIIEELGLEETKDHDSSIYVKNSEKLDEGGYIVVNNNDVFDSNYESVQETLEEMGLKVTANAGEKAGDDETSGNIYDSSYPKQINFSTDYLGTALKVLTEGDKVIITYYK